MVAAMNRTEPSHSAARNPPGRMPTRPCNGLSAGGTKSSGLVQITAAASLASTDHDRIGRAVRDLGKRQSRTAAAAVAVGLLARTLRLYRRYPNRPSSPAPRCCWATDRLAGMRVDQCLVVLAVPRFVQVELLVERLLLDERQDVHAPAQQRLAILVDAVGGRKPAEHVVVVVHGQARSASGCSSTASDVRLRGPPARRAAAAPPAPVRKRPHSCRAACCATRIRSHLRFSALRRWWAANAERWLTSTAAQPY